MTTRVSPLSHILANFRSGPGCWCTSFAPLPHLPPVCPGNHIDVGYGAERGEPRSWRPGRRPVGPPSRSPPTNDVRPSAAEEARTIAASTNTGTLATLTSIGDPWASFVTYGLLDGAPVLCVSNLAEHGRNLAGDPRASIAIVAPNSAIRPARERPRHAGRCRRTADRRRSVRRPRCPPGRRARREVLRRLQRLLAVGAAGTTGCAGSAATAGWIRRPARPTRRPSPTRSAPGPTVRSPTSTPTTPTRCVPWRRRSAATPTPPPRSAPAPTATAST